VVTKIFFVYCQVPAVPDIANEFEHNPVREIVLEYIPSVAPVGFTVAITLYDEPAVNDCETLGLKENIVLPVPEAVIPIPPVSLPVLVTVKVWDSVLVWALFQVQLAGVIVQVT